MLGTASEVGDVSRDFLSLFRIYQSAIIFINRYVVGRIACMVHGFRFYGGAAVTKSRATKIV